MRFVIILAAASLSACAPATTSGQRTEIAQATEASLPDAGIIYERAGEVVVKTCDMGRAVYVFQGYKAGGVFVIPDAKECAPIVQEGGE